MTDEAPPNQGSEQQGGTEGESLQDQIARLQADIKAISETLQRLTGEKIAEAQRTAGGQYEDAVRHGRDMLDDVADQATEFEHTLKRTIREKPLTAVASALGIGYLLALLSRH